MSAPEVPTSDAELVIQFEGWSRRVPLGAQPLVLGRAPECDVQLREPGVSRRHCRLVPSGDGRWLVEDLGSQAGTLLGGVPVEAPAVLGPGDSIQIGPMEARFELRPATGSVLSGDPVRDARNIDLLLRTAGDLHGTESLEDLLRTIVDRAVLLAGGDRGALLLSGPHGSLEAGVARDAQGRDLPPQQALTRTLPGRALATGRAVVLTDTEAAEQSGELPESVRAGAIGSVLCVPLRDPQGPLGVLYVDGRRPAASFGSAELAIFEALAAQGALAIERSRLREARAQREAEARRRLQTENEALRARLGTDASIGQSKAIRQALDLIRRIAPSEATVCLTGETGTGKEVLARYLHGLSPRSGGPFVVVDCGAIPEGLIESELFGHEKGSFTGASAAREGRFREARGGTVFLDEIGELPLALQSRLLRVLQERTVQPVGGTGREPVDVRILCATHRDLARRVEEGQFRQDLYYRISVLTITVPPLRERGEDILLLARAFLDRLGGQGSAVTGFTREAREALLAHAWPGNVRELEHRVQRALLLARPPYATRQDLGFGGEEDLSGPSEEDLSVLPLQEARAKANERFERVYLEDVLRRAEGNVAQAAGMAGISRQVFYRLLHRNGIDWDRFAAEG
jgi:transcriptional regulator with GAF, ATPase, and Fis domain